MVPSTNRIKLTKTSKLLKLGWSEKFTHYSIVLFLLIVPLLTLYDVATYYFFDSYKGVRSIPELIWNSIPFVVASIIMLFIQRERLKFVEADIEYTDEQFKEAVDRTTRELGWIGQNNNKKEFRAVRDSNIGVSWGEFITILRFKNRLLLNSICDPAAPASVLSFGWNRKNIKVFLDNLVDVINGIEEKPKPTLVKNEWSTKNTVIRILIYTFCLFLIVLGFYMVFNSVNYRTSAAGIGCVFFGSFYIYLDIKVLLGKGNERL